jgi:hypothetical protein
LAGSNINGLLDGDSLGKRRSTLATGTGDNAALSLDGITAGSGCRIDSDVLGGGWGSRDDGGASRGLDRGNGDDDRANSLNGRSRASRLGNDNGLVDGLGGGLDNFGGDRVGSAANTNSVGQCRRGDVDDLRNRGSGYWGGDSVGHTAGLGADAGSNWHNAGDQLGSISLSGNSHGEREDLGGVDGRCDNVLTLSRGSGGVGKTSDYERDTSSAGVWDALNRGSCGERKCGHNRWRVGDGCALNNSRWWGTTNGVSWWSRNLAGWARNTRSSSRWASGSVGVLESTSHAGGAAGRGSLNGERSGGDSGSLNSGGWRISSAEGECSGGDAGRLSATITSVAIVLWCTTDVTASMGLGSISSGQGGQEGDSKFHHHVDGLIFLALFLKLNAKAARVFSGRRRDLLIDIDTARNQTEVNSVIALKWSWKSDCSLVLKRVTVYKDKRVRMGKQRWALRGE